MILRILKTICWPALVAAIAFAGVSGGYGWLKRQIHLYLRSHPPISISVRPGGEVFGQAGGMTPETAPFRPSTAKNRPDRLAVVKDELRLMGTVTGNAQTSFAIIKDLRADVQGLFRLNENVRGGSLDLILRDRVVIGFGEREVVLMARGDGASGAPAPVAIGSAAVAAALADLSRTLSQIGIRAHDGGQEGKGIEIMTIAPGSIYETLGLQPGDIIHSVNGAAIENPRIIEALHRRVRATPVAISVDNPGVEASRLVNRIFPEAAGIGSQIASALQKLESGGDVVMKLRRSGRVQEIAYHMKAGSVSEGYDR